MRIEKLGLYEDEETGKQYVVLKRINEIEHKPVASRAVTKMDGSHDFITECGIDLNALDENLNAFELMQIDGIIKRART